MQCIKKKKILPQTTHRNQGEQREGRIAQTGRVGGVVVEDYKKYLPFTKEQLKQNQHYTLDLYMKLMSSIGKRPDIQNYRKNISAMLFIVAEHSHKEFLRDFSPQFDKRRRDFFLQFYCLPNLFHPI